MRPASLDGVNMVSTVVARVGEQPLPTNRAAIAGSAGIEPCSQHEQSRLM
jgi:hypothetical protein